MQCTTFTMGVQQCMEFALNISIMNCLQLQIWDTAGQERFRTITQSYYRSANGVIVAYDISKQATFDSCTRWIDDVKKYAAPNIVQMLIGIEIFGSLLLYHELLCEKMLCLKITMFNVLNLLH